MTREAFQSLVAQLVTADRLEAALRSLPLEAAARAVVEPSVEGQREPDDVVTALGVLSVGAQTLALLRGASVGDSMLVDPWKLRIRQK